MSTQCFLLRPRPFPGESLSSWRQRAGIENGFSLYPRRNAEAWRTDPDRIDAHTRKWLQQAFGVDEGEIDPLCLPRRSTWAEDLSTGQWVTPLRYTAAKLPRGPVACTSCLLRDKEPHFRLDWRYAFFTTCPVHAAQLIDRCPSCGAMLWPNSVMRPALFRQRRISLHECATCHEDLRKHVPPAADARSTRMVQQVIATDRLELPAGRVIDAQSFMESLRFLAQLFFWAPTAPRLRAHFGLDDTLPPSSRSVRLAAVEQADVVERQAVYSRALHLLQTWPEGIAATAEACELSWHHVSGIGRSPPMWMAAELREMIARQHRGVTVGMVRDAADTITRSGAHASKAKVAAALGCVEPRALSLVLGRRYVATRQEFRAFTSELRAYMTAAQRRRSSLAVRARDSAIVALLVLEGRGLSSPMPSAPSEALAWLSRTVPIGESGARLQALAYRGMETWLELSRALWGMHAEQAFRGPRGHVDLKRAVSHCLGVCMRPIDRRLARDPRVFADLLTSSPRIAEG